MPTKHEHIGEIIEVEFCDEHGDLQMLRVTPLAGARVARAIVDALRDAGYIDEDADDAH